MKIAIISSSGGHLTEVRCLRPAYEGYPHFYVLNDRVLLPPDMEGRTQFIVHAERDWRVVLNFFEAFRIMLRERPALILSTGAGPVVPFAFWARAVFRIPVVFVETITRIEKPSLTGRLMYWLATDFYYQWEQLQDYFPRGRFAGPLI
jgi:beta-1,4-N-acetylglucosaminyltransferase